MPSSSRSSPATDTGLLLAYLRPERARLAALGLVLVVAMLAPVAGPVLLGSAIDRALGGGEASGVLGMGAAYLAVTLGGDLLRVVVAWSSVRLAWRVGNRLRLDLARHALALDLEWHSRHSPGELIERLDGDIEAVVRFSSAAVLQMVGNAVLLVGVLVVSCVVDWRAGLLIGGAAAVAVTVMVRLRTVAVPAHDAEREVQARLYGDLEERLGGLEDIRANGAGDYVVHRLTGHSARWWRTARRAGLVSGAAYTGAGATFTVGSVLTLALGVALHRQGALTIGATLTLFRFSQMVRDPVERIGEQLREMQRAVAGVRRASQLLATRPALDDGPGTPLPDGPLAVELDGVTLRYDTGQVALDGVSLRLAPGTVLGVVGRTGSGKTSLGRLLARLWDPTEGTVSLGGVDLRDVADDDLRHRVAVVGQDVELFDASLRDNLTLFATRAASDTELREALRAVGLRTWLAGRPQGLDGRLDARALSAGEAQLVAFARVLLSDPGLVLLDEATSRLDPATEARLTAATESALAGRTAVVIAHRLSTLERVDEVCVVDGGLVVEHGPREALAAGPDSHYARLLRAAGTTPTATAGPAFPATPAAPMGPATGTSAAPRAPTSPAAPTSAASPAAPTSAAPRVPTGPASAAPPVALPGGGAEDEVPAP